MKTIYIYCEGPTEESFINAVLYPYFLGMGIYVCPIVCETRRDANRKYRGGVSRYAYATQHDYQEDIPSDIFPYDYRYAACQKIENWNRNYAQAQGQPKRLHNMRPVVR